MENIRNAGKKHRVIMLVVVIALCLAMVIGFATWGSLDSSQSQQSYDISSQIKYYEDYLNELLASEDGDNTLKGQIAGTYETLASLYNQAANSEKAAEATDKANAYYIDFYEALVAEQRNAEGDNRALLASYLGKLSDYYSAAGESEKAEAAAKETLVYQETLLEEYSATAKTEAEANNTSDAYQRNAGYYLYNLASVYAQNGKNDKATVCYLEAAEYYHKATNLLGTAADPAVRANYLVDEATCLFNGDDVENAAAKYEEAIALAPSDINVVQAYIQFVWQKDGIEAAYELLPQYQQYFTKEGDAKAAFDNLSSYITLFYQISQPVEDEGSESSDK